MTDDERGPNGAVAVRDARSRRTRPALVATRVTVTQLLRNQRDTPRLLAVVVGFNLFVGWTLVGVTGTGTYDLGVALAAGEAESVAATLREGVVTGLVLVAVLQVLGAGSDGRAKHRRVSFLTATSTAAVVVAIVARRVVSALVLFGPGLAAAAVAFAVGAGAPTSALSIGLASGWLVVAAAVATLPLGLVANWVVAGYDLSSNARLGLGAVVLGAFYLALFGRTAVAAVLLGTPVGWAGDLFLLGVPGAGASRVRAAAFAVGSLAVVAAAGAVSVRLADAAWYSDPAFGDRDDGDDADDATNGAFATSTGSGFSGPLRRLCSPRTTALVALTWRRTRRTPKVLFYVYPSLFVGVVMAEQLVIHGPFAPALSPAIVGFAGATAVGSGFTLNPLGTEGDALPALLTAGAGDRRIVRAKALAAGLPGGALVVGGTLAVGALVGPVPPVVLASATLSAAALVALAPLLSQALGVHYPPDHEDLLGGSVKVPNKSASAIYSLGMVTVALPGFAAVAQYAHGGGVDPTVIVTGTGVTVVGALVLTWWSYRHAAAKLASYSIE